jgi:hypothetical protein
VRVSPQARVKNVGIACSFWTYESAGWTVGVFREALPYLEFRQGVERAYYRVFFLGAGICVSLLGRAMLGSLI